MNVDEQEQRQQQQQQQQQYEEMLRQQQRAYEASLSLAQQAEQQQQEASFDMMATHDDEDEEKSAREALLELAAVDPDITGYLHRWLAALQQAMPALAATWAALAEDLPAVAQYCVAHYSAPESCLTQAPDALGALEVSEHNNEFLPGLSAHDLFNQHHVSRGLRESMVAYSQCMFALVCQWLGIHVDARGDARPQVAFVNAAAAAAAYDQQQPQVHARLSTERYADAFRYVLERSRRHETLRTGVAAIDGFLASATGQWVAVKLVRQLFAVHTDAMVEALRATEELLGVNVGDSGVWTEHLVPLLFRRTFVMLQSPARRGLGWSWFEGFWGRWFGEGAPLAFVSRAELGQRADGRGMVYPDSAAADIRNALASDACREMLTQLRLPQAEVVGVFDRIVAEWATGNEESVANVVRQFMESPVVVAAVQSWTAELVGGGGGGGAGAGGATGGAPASASADGRRSQREAAIARCRARASQAQQQAQQLQHQVENGGGGAAAMPMPDTRPIEELLAFIGEAPAQPDQLQRPSKQKAKQSRKR